MSEPKPGEYPDLTAMVFWPWDPDIFPDFYFQAMQNQCGRKTDTYTDIEKDDDGAEMKCISESETIPMLEKHFCGEWKEDQRATEGLSRGGCLSPLCVQTEEGSTETFENSESGYNLVQDDKKALW